MPGHILFHSFVVGYICLSVKIISVQLQDFDNFSKYLNNHIF